MNISEKSIEKFKILYKQIFSEELSDAEAIEKAAYLLNAYRFIYGNPMSEIETNKEVNN